MEKDRSTKVIAIVALLVGVVGLTLGFAAFSTSLQINTQADVEVSTGNWNVGFSTNGTSVISYGNTSTVTGTNQLSQTSGSIDVTKYTISQTANSNAVLTTTTGSEVKYNLYIANAGTLTAYSDTLTFPSTLVTCTPVSGSNSSVIEGTENAGTTETGGNSTTISDADCNAMFGVDLKIGGTTYTPTNASTFNDTIASLGNSPVELRIYYKGDTAANTAAAALDGDIVVTSGTITVVYKSNNS